jgi:sulfite oxidase
VLLAAGLETGAAHVAFTGLDRCTEEGEVTPFGGSIPLAKELAPEVLLADEMNGKPLPPAHGHPLRVIVPGYIGARSVKWLATITVQDQPSTNYFQARTYRLYPSRVRSETTPGEGFSLGQTPVNSAICHPGQGAFITGPRVLARGYALTGGTREIERVETTLNHGASFTTARMLDGHHPSGWRMWETELTLYPGVHELAVRGPWTPPRAPSPRARRESATSRATSTTPGTESGSPSRANGPPNPCRAERNLSRPGRPLLTTDTLKRRGPSTFDDRGRCAPKRSPKRGSR